MHLEAEIIYHLNKLEIKRVFRLYADCPAIACDFYYRGHTDSIWTNPKVNSADMINLEKLAAANTSGNLPVIEKIELPVADIEGRRAGEVPLCLRYDQKRGESKMPVSDNARRLRKLMLTWRREGLEPPAK